jgi:outer membrane protein assembly factor BamB
LYPIKFDLYWIAALAPNHVTLVTREPLNYYIYTMLTKILLAPLLLSSGAYSQAGNVWGMFRKDARHRATSPYLAPISSPVTFWSVAVPPTGYDITTSPVIDARGIIYGIGGNGQTFAINSSTYPASLLWSVPTSIAGYVNNKNLASPCLTDSRQGVLFVSSDNSSAFALNTSTGATIWSWQVEPSILTGGCDFGSPVYFDGLVYLATCSGYIYTFNVTSGKNATLYYVTQADQGFYNTPVIDTQATADQAFLFVSDNKGYTHAIKRSGDLKWKDPPSFGYSCESSPVLYDKNGVSLVIFGCSDGVVYAMDRVDGTVAWSATLATAAGSLTIYSSPVIDTSRDIFYIGFNDGVAAIDLLAALRIAAAGCSPKPICDVISGALLWSFSTPTKDAFVSSPALGADGTVYIGCGGTSDLLFAFSNATGNKPLWSFNPSRGNIVSSPAISANGTIIIGSKDGSVYAIGGAPGSPSVTPSASMTKTPSSTVSITPTRTRTMTPSPCPTPSVTPSQSLTASVTASQSPTPLATPSQSPTPTKTPSRSPTPLATPTPSPAAAAAASSLPLTTIIIIAAVGAVVLILPCATLGVLRYRRAGVLMEHRSKVERFLRRAPAFAASGDGGSGAAPVDAGAGAAEKAAFDPVNEGGAEGGAASLTAAAPGAVVVPNPLSAAAAASGGGAPAGTSDGGASQSTVQLARAAAAAAAAEAARAKAQKLGVSAPVDDAYAHVPVSALSPGQRFVERLVPGAYTLGLGVFGTAVPPSHDLSHPRGPSRAGTGIANVPTVSIGSALAAGSSRGVSLKAWGETPV